MIQSSVDITTAAHKYGPYHFFVHIWKHIFDVLHVFRSHLLMRGWLWGWKSLGHGERHGWVIHLGWGDGVRLRKEHYWSGRDWFGWFLEIDKKYLVMCLELVFTSKTVSLILTSDSWHLCERMISACWLQVVARFSLCREEFKRYPNDTDRDRHDNIDHSLFLFSLFTAQWIPFINSFSRRQIIFDFDQAPGYLRVWWKRMLKNTKDFRNKIYWKSI